MESVIRISKSNKRPKTMKRNILLWPRYPYLNILWQLKGLIYVTRQYTFHLYTKKYHFHSRLIRLTENITVLKRKENKRVLQPFKTLNLIQATITMLWKEEHIYVATFMVQQFLLETAACTYVYMFWILIYCSVQRWIHYNSKYSKEGQTERSFVWLWQAAPNWTLPESDTGLNI